MLLLATLLSVSHASVVCEARRPASFTVRLPKRLPAEAFLLTGGAARLLPRFKTGPRPGGDVARQAWRWKDLRTGQEIGAWTGY